MRMKTAERARALPGENEPPVLLVGSREPPIPQSLVKWPGGVTGTPERVSGRSRMGGVHTGAGLSSLLVSSASCASGVLAFRLACTGGTLARIS